MFLPTNCFWHKPITIIYKLYIKGEFHVKKRPSEWDSRLLFAKYRGLFLNNHNLFNQIALTDGIENIQTFENLAEASVNAVQVLRVLAVVADEELRTTSVLASVGHRENAAVVILTASAGFAFDAITRTACARARVTQVT